MSSSLSNQQVFSVSTAICGSYRNINRLLIAGLFQDSGDSSWTEPCTICHTVLVGAHNKYRTGIFIKFKGQNDIISTPFIIRQYQVRQIFCLQIIWNQNYKSLKRWPSQRQCTLGWKASLTLDNALTLTYDRAI